MPPTIFLDLDGTLLDTTYLHTIAWWRALDDAGERRPMAAIHPLIGMGSQELLGRLLGHDEPGISDRHGEHFAEMHRFIRPLPGGADLVARTKASGCQAVAVTSAKKRDLGALLDALNSKEDFDEVVYGDEVEQAKPSPDVFVAALRRSGADPRECLAVGDAVWDIKSAAKAGVACVAVETGGIERRTLEQAGALTVYRDCAEIVRGWATSPLGQLAPDG